MILHADKGIYMTSAPSLDELGDHSAAAGETILPGAAGELFVRWWQPNTPFRAVLAICPGFNSHSGYYTWVGERCAATGLAAYAVDLRGRGHSTGERFYVERFEDYVADFEVMVDHARAAHPGAPLFLLGHSAGGVVVSLYALEHGAGIAGLITEGIAFEVKAPASRWRC